MGKVTILPETTKEPITFMGFCAGLAYGSDIHDPQKNFNRGKNCIASDHGRMWEFPDVYMLFEDYSVRVMREYMRHVGDGLTAVQSSTRYINEENFDYYIPDSCKNNSEALRYYCRIMQNINNGYTQLIDTYGIPKEDSANVLPLGLHCKVISKHNPRTLINMSKKRLCSRAYPEFRNGLMADIKNELAKYSPEWKIITDNFFKPQCEFLGYCPEKNGCGRYPEKPIEIK